MKPGKKIAVGLAAAFAIAMFAAGAVSMVGAISVPLPYVVVVADGPDVSVVIGTGGVDFGSLPRGGSTTLSDSLVLTNTGDTMAKVEAGFTTSVGTLYGLVNGDSSRVLPASNLELGTTGKEVALADTGVDVDLGVFNNVPASGGVINYNAIQAIPEGQPADTYAGLIELTISTA